ncbi:MAG: serine/threonine protein kinase [Myxococcaceae bacterium]|nr:serine/threonine protein kinase [Myxococcaceae bacterium]
MSPSARKLIAVALVVGALAVAAVLSAQHRRHLVDAGRAQAAAAAERAWDERAQALGGLTAPMAERARLVASLENFQGILKATTSQSDLKELANTLADALEHESWLRTPVAGTATTFFLGKHLVSSQTPALASRFERLLEGADLAPAGALVAQDGKAWLLALARTKTENLSGEPAFVGLARELTTADLGTLPAGVAVSLVVEDRTREAITTGSAEGVASLQRRRTSKVQDESGCCVVKDLEPGLSLAVFRDPSPERTAAEAEASRAQWPRFGVAAGLSLVVAALLVFTGRRSRDDEARDALLRETQAQLRQSHEVLQKLSTGAFATQAANAPGLAALDDGLGATQASAQSSRYEVIAPLGEGGMARVSVAVARGAEGFKRTFVVKRLKAEHAGNQELVNQFIDEARLGASLVHSNIVPVFDFGRDAEGYYLAQEYILGRSVEALVEAAVRASGRPPAPALIAAIGQEALKAIAYAHTRTDAAGKPAGLVHRDVSPANLMVSQRGEVKLLDFGIVKSADRVTKTQAGMVKGNLFFMSPEQARALEVDFRSDLFSLGMVLAFAALGRTLYQGDSVLELMNRAAVGPTAADLDVVRAGVGPFAGFLEKALAVDPALRFQTAAEMASALAQAVPAAPAMELEALMRTLFQAELESERRRFSEKA